MVWERLDNQDKDARHALDKEFRGKVRFLVDESMDPMLVSALHKLGWKAQSAADVSLAGRSDEDVLAHAWRKKQLLLTSDRDFLDDRRFPPHRNPGIIVLPNAPIDSDFFTTALSRAIYTIAPLGKAYRGSKIVITTEGVISITTRNLKTGRMETNRFRVDSKGNSYIWRQAQKTN